MRSKAYFQKMIHPETGDMEVAEIIPEENIIKFPGKKPLIIPYKKPSGFEEITAQDYDPDHTPL